MIVWSTFPEQRRLVHVVVGEWLEFHRSKATLTRERKEEDAEYENQMRAQVQMQLLFEAFGVLEYEGVQNDQRPEHEQPGQVKV